jgi:hypothetical protein
VKLNTVVNTWRPFTNTSRRLDSGRLKPRIATSAWIGELRQTEMLV